MKTYIDRSTLLTSMITGLTNEEMAVLISIMKSEMAKRGNDLPVKVEDSNTTVRVKTVCRNVKIYYWEEFSCYTKDEIKKFRNIGRKAFDEIIDELTKRGIILE